MSNVILYSTGCPRCETLKQMLNSKPIDYSVVSDVDEMLKLGFTNVPMLRVDNRIMNYNEAVEYLKALTKRRFFNEKQ